MSQKINLGNYETRDYFIELEASIEDSELNQATKELRKFCEDEVIKYYNNIKGISKTEQSELDLLEKQIVEAKDAEELKVIAGLIKEDNPNKNLILKRINKELIKRKNEKC